MPVGEIDYAEVWINLNEPSNIVSRTTPFIQMKYILARPPAILKCINYLEVRFKANGPVQIYDSKGRAVFNGDLFVDKYLLTNDGTAKYVVKSQVSGWRAITCNRVELDLPRMGLWDFNILLLWSQPTLENVSTALTLLGHDLTPEQIANSTCAVVKDILSSVADSEKKSSLQQVTPAQIVKIIRQSNRGRKQ